MENTEVIAKEALEKAKAQREALKGGKAPEPEKAKETPKPEVKEEIKSQEVLEKEAKEKADSQAKEEARILESEDDKLSEDDKKKKSELKINKRIGELTGKIKDAERSNKSKDEEIERLRKEKAELEKKALPPENSPEEVLKKSEETRLKKYLEEDKEKERSQRREMSKEELNEWLVEDYVEASQWIADRAIRRREDKVNDQRTLANKRKAQEIIEQQKPYIEEGLKSHPELDISKRQSELESEGKTPQEINSILLKENNKYRLVVDIIKEHPEWRINPKGPKLVQEELEKRLKVPDSEVDTEKEELKKKLSEIEAELKRVKSIDSEKGSSRGGSSSGKPKTEEEKREDEILNRAGIPRERIDAMKLRRSKIAGANSGKG